VSEQHSFSKEQGGASPSISKNDRKREEPGTNKPTQQRKKSKTTPNTANRTPKEKKRQNRQNFFFVHQFWQNTRASQNRTTCKTTYHNEGTKGPLLPDLLFLIT